MNAAVSGWGELHTMVTNLTSNTTKGHALVLKTPMEFVRTWTAVLECFYSELVPFVFHVPYYYQLVTFTSIITQVFIKYLFILLFTSLRKRFQGCTLPNTNVRARFVGLMVGLLYAYVQDLLILTSQYNNTG